MVMNRQGRPSRPLGEAGNAPETYTGNRALQLETPLLFEEGDWHGTGVDLPEPSGAPSRLGGFAAD